MRHFPSQKLDLNYEKKCQSIKHYWKDKMNLKGIKMTSDTSIHPVTSCDAASLGFIFSKVGSHFIFKSALKSLCPRMKSCVYEGFGSLTDDYTHQKSSFWSPRESLQPIVSHLFRLRCILIRIRL